MKKRRISILIVCCLVLFIGIGYSFASGLSQKSKKSKETPAVHQYFVEQTEKRVNDAWNDIKNTYKINTQDYTVLSLQDLPQLTAGKLDNFKDEKYIQEADGIINSFIDAIPNGSIMPMTLLKKDGSEILVCYKDKDGNNIVAKAVKNKADTAGIEANAINATDTWNKTSDSKPGSPVMPIDMDNIPKN